MKFTDRVPTKPQYRKIKNVDTGEIITAIVSYADEPTEEGTPLNAHNLNKITEDIVSQLNNSLVGTVRDNTGAVIMETSNNFSKYGDVWIYTENNGEIRLSPTSTRTMSIEITLNITPPITYYFYYPEVILSYESGTGLDNDGDNNVIANVEMFDAEGNSFGTSSNFYMTSNNGMNFNYKFDRKIGNYLTGYGNGKPLPLTYKIDLSISAYGGVRVIKNLTLQASCYAEKKHIFEINENE